MREFESLRESWQIQAAIWVLGHFPAVAPFYAHLEPGQVSNAIAQPTVLGDKDALYERLAALREQIGDRASNFVPRTWRERPATRAFHFSLATRKVSQVPDLDDGEFKRTRARSVAFQHTLNSVLKPETVSTTLKNQRKFQRNWTEPAARVCAGWEGGYSSV